MRVRRSTGPPAFGLCLFLTITLIASRRGRGSEPLETVRAALRASSDGLKSGVGKGRYRRYEAVPGQDWQLNVDADVSTYFGGSKYHIDLAFLRNDLRDNTSSRTVCDGKHVTVTWFSPLSTAHSK